ncbi:MAG: hypothetical protein P8Y53_25785, partial [Pseudolabrys sp.]
MAVDRIEQMTLGNPGMNPGAANHFRPRLAMRLAGQIFEMPEDALAVAWIADARVKLAVGTADDGVQRPLCGVLIGLRVADGEIGG